MLKYTLRMLTMDGELIKQFDGLNVRRTQRWDSWQPHSELDQWVDDGPKTRRVRVVSDRYGKGSPANDTEPQPALKEIDGRMRFAIGDKEIKDPDKQPNAFRALSVFTLVMRVLNMFEDERDGIGRGIPFASPSQPLKVHVWAEDPSASPIYVPLTQDIILHRPNGVEGHPIITADSPDIVCHEVAHAVIDGLLPFLASSKFVEPIAIHESIADLCAFFGSMNMNSLREVLMEKVDHDLTKADAFAHIAEEYGSQTSTSRKHYLRSVNTDKTRGSILDPKDFYEVGSVFSGMIFDVLCDEVVSVTNRIKKDKPEIKHTSAVGKAFSEAKWKIWRILCRGLEYLPPGDAGLFDLVSAIYLADEVAYGRGNEARTRQSIVSRAIERELVNNLDSILEVNIAHQLESELKDRKLLLNDHALINALKNPSIKSGITMRDSVIRVDRLNARKVYTRSGENDLQVDELIIKVAWQMRVGLDPLTWDGDRSKRLFGLTIAADAKTLKIRYAMKIDPKNTLILK